MLTKIQCPKGEINLINTHLIASYPTFKKNYISERREQFKELQDILNKLSGHTIIAGDFNCGPEVDFENYDVLINEYFVNLKKEDAMACRESTYSINNPRNTIDLGKIDHIFFGKDFHYFSSETIFKEKFSLNGIQDVLSDHYGLNVKLGLK